MSTTQDCNHARVEQDPSFRELASPNDQNVVFDFLNDSTSYEPHQPVVRIDTHCAVVFLAGDNVYKVKRAVKYPFLDFSTLEKRHAGCLAEMEVNRDNAPELYLGVIPITYEGGVMAFAGQGEIVEWAVHLKRFDENATFDRLASKGPLGGKMIGKVAAMIVRAHERAPTREDPAAAQRLRTVMSETLEELAAAPDIFPVDEVAKLETAMEAAYERIEPLLLQRAMSGQVRRCHGDLHLGNIALIDGEPLLFDAIEFDDAIATCDVLYDLAFLLMDLWERDLRGDANLLLNSMIKLSDDEDLQIQGLEALPLFLSLRAAIRAKVLAASVRLEPKWIAQLAQALTYFSMAARFLETYSPCLLAIGGMSGTGKTTLAAAIAPGLGRPPGALHLRSDIERKHIFGVAEGSRLPVEAYAPAATREVYERLRRLARLGLRAGQAVILDATHLQKEDRDEAAELAMQADVAFTGLWLEAPIPVLADRVAARVNDASDATPATVAAQHETQSGPVDWHRLDTTRSLEVLTPVSMRFLTAADDAS